MKASRFPLTVMVAATIGLAGCGFSTGGHTTTPVTPISVAIATAPTTMFVNDYNQLVPPPMMLPV